MNKLAITEAFSEKYLKFITIAFWPFILICMALSHIGIRVINLIFSSLAFFALVTNAVYIVTKILLYVKKTK